MSYNGIYCDQCHTCEQCGTENKNSVSKNDNARPNAYCKPAFSSAFFHEFRHVGDIPKITGCEYLKSRAILLCYLVQQAKMLKLRQTK